MWEEGGRREGKKERGKSVRTHGRVWLHKDATSEESLPRGESYGFGKTFGVPAVRLKSEKLKTKERDYRRSFTSPLSALGNSAWLTRATNQCVKFSL